MNPLRQRHYWVSQEDVDRIDSMLGILNLAIGELLESRRLHDPPETLHACDEFDAYMEPFLSMTDRERQMEFPWADLYEPEF